MWLKKRFGSVGELPEWWHSEVGSLKRNNHQEANILVCELRVLVNSAILKKRLGRTGTNMQATSEAQYKVRANQSFKYAHFVRPTTNRSLCSQSVAA